MRAESIPTTPIGYWWLEGERGSSGVRKLWYWAVIAAGEIRPNRVWEDSKIANRGDRSWIDYNGNMITKEQVYKQLSTVMDPELHIDIVSLGLIYHVDVEEDQIKVIMTLTTPGCPLAPVIDKLIKKALSSLKAKDVRVELVWEPAWTKEMMSEEAKLTLGMI